MHPSMRSALNGLFDYAGLYPPADLSFTEAIAEYQSHRDRPEGFMVGRFVCGPSHLPALSDWTRTHPSAQFEIAVVGPPTTTQEAWEAALDKCAVAMSKYDAGSADGPSVEAFEIKVPDNKNVDRWLRDLRNFEGIELFVELPWDDHQADAIAHIAELELLGVKARTGGLTPELHPSADQVARFIHGCCGAEVPFKLTAGLHHPLPAMFKPYELGFLNVVVATAMALAEDLSSSEIAEFLTEKQFDVAEDAISAADLTVDMEDIEDARSLLVAIGSCSISEPVADLQKLGLWTSL